MSSLFRRAVADQWAPREVGQVVILDNRDSFVLNLAHRFAELDEVVGVLRSDRTTVEDLEALKPSALVVSPGPDHPRDAGISVEAIGHFLGEIPILGVCLGHQAIAMACGGPVVASGAPRHGMSSDVTHDGTGLFAGLSSPVSAGRYHSLIATELPDELVANAWADGFVMGLRHRELPVHGVQFHPESILTPQGYEMLRAFLSLRGSSGGRGFL